MIEWGAIRPGIRKRLFEGPLVQRFELSQVERTRVTRKTAGVSRWRDNRVQRESVLLLQFRFHNQSARSPLANEGVIERTHLCSQWKEHNTSPAYTKEHTGYFYN